jgi:hypothetical protein
MGNQQATDAELGWLAGIIDGEGYLGMSLESEHNYREGYQTRQHSIKVEIKVVNCDPEIVVKTAQVMQKLGVNPYIRQPAVELKVNHKVHYEASIKRMAPVKRVLEAVLPYLVGSKLERANIILRFIQLRTDNPGVVNPAYADNAKGRHGPRVIKPYSTEELELVDQCRALQSRKGASEITRATGAAILQQMKQRVVKLQELPADVEFLTSDEQSNIQNAIVNAFRIPPELL